MRHITRHRISTFGIAAVAALGISAGTAQAAGPVAGATRSATASSEDVKTLSLRGRMLRIELACSGSGYDVLVRTPARAARLQGACAGGSARPKLVLRRVEARAAQLRAGLAVTVLETKTGQLLTAVRFAPPGPPSRALQANLVWTTANAVCWAGSPGQMNVQAYGATFGYAVGTKLTLRGMVLDYNYTTRAYTWVYGPWQTYYAGLNYSFAPGTQLFNAYPNHAVRGAIQIYGGDWNYVRVGSALGNYTDGAWCRF
jgi:hypothetical protein